MMAGSRIAFRSKWPNGRFLGARINCNYDAAANECVTRSLDSLYSGSGPLGFRMGWGRCLVGGQRRRAQIQMTDSGTLSAQFTG
jgi:hypothetical protein